MKMNENYKKIIEMGYTLECRSGRNNLDRVYLCRNGKRILKEDYWNNRGKGNSFAYAYRNSHKDKAMASFIEELQEIHKSAA